MATRHFVPRGDNQGGIGRSEKAWQEGYINDFHAQKVTTDDLEINNTFAVNTLEATSIKSGDKVVNVSQLGPTLWKVNTAGEIVPKSLEEIDVDALKTDSETIENIVNRILQTNPDIINPSITNPYSVEDGVAHNGVYRGKNLGTFTTVAEVEAFLTEHKVSEGLFTDLFIGDYFTLQDGTYNKEWEIAGFDTYFNKGDTAFTSHHLALIPIGNLLTIGMNASDTTTNGFVGSRMFTQTLPTVNTNMTKVLGTHLLTRRALLSNAMTSTVASGALSSWQGASTNWAWTDVKACLMSEVAVYGSRVLSSSFYDVGEDCERLPIFQFKNHVHKSRNWFWLRAVASSSRFCGADGYGTAGCGHASGSDGGVVPLICVG